MSTKAKRSFPGLMRALFQVGAGVGPLEPTTVLIDVGGEPIEVRLRRSARARRVTVRVSATARDVVLTVPKRVPLRAALTFLDRHSDWVTERCASWAPMQPLAAGKLVPLRGQMHRIRRASEKDGLKIRRSLDPEPTLHVPGTPERVGARLVAHLKAQARRDLEAAVARYCAKIGREPARLTLRDPKGRWGSCSSKGTLSFSWRLVLAPRHVLNYVAAHEVAHLEELNHGPRFWRLVEELDPNFRAAETWLKAHGAGLHRYACG